MEISFRHRGGREFGRSFDDKVLSGSFQGAALFTHLYIKRCAILQKRSSPHKPDPSLHYREKRERSVFEERRSFFLFFEV
jgi:hypothetical protein